MTQFIYTVAGIVLLTAVVLFVAWRDAKKRGELSRERLHQFEAEERRERELEERSFARRGARLAVANGKFHKASHTR